MIASATFRLFKVSFYRDVEGHCKPRNSIYVESGERRGNIRALHFA